MATDNRPNIVILVADDHRGTALGHLGIEQATTPVLDALAARGVSFSGAHCQGSMHGAVCVPSRASLLTGRSIFDSSDDPTGRDYGRAITVPRHLETFPEALRGAGYRTHAVGKWHNDAAAFNRSFGSGEALMFGGMSDHDRVPLRRYDPSGAYPDSAVAIGDGFSTDIFADAAIRFIENDQESDPFLLYVAFTAPHDPRTPPPAWERDPDGIGLPPNFLPGHPFDNAALAGRDELLAAHPRTEVEIRRHIAGYYGMIAHLDHAVGRILEALEARGLGGDTVVIYTADHGLAVGQHGLMGKQNLYQHSLRVPLVMVGPGIPAGNVVDDLAWHADTTATIRHLAGIESDASAAGISLIDEKGHVAAGRERLGAAYAFGQRMFRDERYKLIHYRPAPEGFGGSSPGSDMVQLFDLAVDPWEITNLAGDDALRDVRHRLEMGLATWQAETHDPMRQVSS